MQRLQEGVTLDLTKEDREAAEWKTKVRELLKTIRSSNGTLGATRGQDEK